MLPLLLSSEVLWAEGEMGDSGGGGVGVGEPEVSSLFSSEILGVS